MKRLSHKLQFFFEQQFKRFRQKREKGWSGLTLLIMKDDADEPIRLRINLYVVYFALLLVFLLPAASGGLALVRQLREEPADAKIEDRKRLLLNIPIILAERKSLLKEARGQVINFYEATDSGNERMFKDWLASLSNRPGEKVAPGAILGLNLDELRALHLDADQALAQGASHALRLFWHRISIYHLTPRGRPLLTGIGFISSGFGQRPDPFGNPTGEVHTGMDFAAAPNIPIIATAPGVVMQVSRTDRPGYGLFVRIHHGLGYSSLYAHCSSLLVDVGDRVQRGQQLALLGKTGRATGHHVHYEVRLGMDKPTDPMPYVMIK
ncbi:MAG: M23 family metallopeptidase [Leptospirales bacterium]|nr:M23 family metallopeptidase [Leptospirales bacterium]